MASTNANDDIAGNSKLGKATSPVKINIQSFTCLRTNLSKYEIQTVKSGWSKTKQLPILVLALGKIQPYDNCTPDNITNLMTTFFNSWRKAHLIAIANIEQDNKIF